MDINTGKLGDYQDILDKLGEFSRRYYTKRLIKGCLLFIAFGLMSWLLILALEYMLWLNQQARFVLLVVFILVELALLYTFVVTPISFLTGIRRGLTNKEAAKLIAIHFPDLSDQLYNLLDLSENDVKGELILASIEQRSHKLKNIPFAKAVRVVEGFKYSKYIVIPFLVLGVVWIFGDISAFLSSHSRIVNYEVAFEKPAPFRFVVLNEDLTVLDSEPLEVKVAVVGGTKPENVFMVVEGTELLMKSDGNIFTQRFNAPVQEANFYLKAGEWNSIGYAIKSLGTPQLDEFSMHFDYPDYLNREDNSSSGTGNAVVPEGTKVRWSIGGTNIGNVHLKYMDTTVVMKALANGFVYNLELFDDFDYRISTSNDNVVDFEQLEYKVEVIKDAYPTVQMEQVLDSVEPNFVYFSGLSADDYGIRSINVVCREVGSAMEQRLILEEPEVAVKQFYYTFPTGFDLDGEKNYEIYFEVVDNDGIRGGKVTKSETFGINLITGNKLIDNKLETQKRLIDNFEGTFREYKEDQDKLKRLREEDALEPNSNFDKKSDVKDLVERQNKQEELIKSFSKKLKDGLELEDRNDDFKKLLQERLERQELEAEKNRRLLEELGKVAERIDEEELKKKLEELGKNQSSGTRNLEQLLELTKRYYVTEKMRQLALDFKELAGEQLELSRKNHKDSLQKDVNDKFDILSDELDELRKDNDDLKKPLNINVPRSDQDGIKEDQRKALKELRNLDDGSKDALDNKPEGAKRRQKSAGGKMEQIGEKLQSGASAGGGSEVAEDAEMLRQVLDNLITFSFKQEALLDQVESADVEIATFSNTVRDQKELRRLFEHVDDSLFALSLRRVELSEFVNEHITEVYYNIDKALESVAENQIYQGVSYQQYVINATNRLAEFLADVLENMQQSMKPGQGQGQGQDFQLPDIIQGQGSIQEMINGSGKDDGGKEGQGEKGEKDGNGSGGDEGEKSGRKDGSFGTGQEGDGGENSGHQDGEMGSNRIYEIYKEQQRLRELLEQQLGNLIENSDRDLAKKLLRQMEDFENDLLENGITERTRNKVNNIQHQLMKLENAALKQGNKKERESNTNLGKFNGPNTTKPDLFEERRNNVEILNRQALPLRPGYDKKVKGYFKDD